MPTALENRLNRATAAQSRLPKSWCRAYAPGMDLKTFISETLVSIVEGVTDAQDRIASSSTTAAVALLDRPADQAGWRNPTSGNVDFDVAITTVQESSSETGGKGGLKIYVVSAGLEAKDAAASKSEAASRVRFSVPTHLPVMHSSNRAEADQRRDEKINEQIRRHGHNLA